MNHSQLKLQQFKDKFLSTQKILCTGNPTRKYSIASGICKIFSDANFISESTGYDLRLETDNSKELFRDKIKHYNILINSSYIEHGAQLKILNFTKECWKYGHIINIGSSSEYMLNDTKNTNIENDEFKKQYSTEKLKLRNRSIELDDYRIKTTHIILSGLVSDHPANVDFLKTTELAELIKWIIDSPYNIPIIGFGKDKTPY